MTTSPAFDANKVYAARLYAVRARPYLATALYALHIVESTRVPTIGVDRYWRCYVSPAFVAQRPVAELASLLVHAVSHLLRDHHGRSERYARAHGAGSRADRLRMNIAADAEIDDDAFGDGLPIPDDAVLPSTLQLPAGRLMEDYLQQLGLGPCTDRLAWLDCGSGADGLDRAWELGPEGANALSDQQQEAVRFRVANSIIGHPGSAPRGWRRWAEEALHPPQPWRSLLGAAIRSATASSGAGDDYTYRRPARRSAAVPGAVLPSLRRAPPRVGVIVDTSGSVSDADLGSALLEVAAIVRAVGGRRDLVTVLSCDAAARIVHPLCTAEDIPLFGGGGTDLRAGFTRVLRSTPRPDVVVVLTDGQTPWPNSRPRCRTVVGLFPRFASLSEANPDFVPDRPPEWAQVVEIGTSRT